MTKVKLGCVLKEEKTKIDKADGGGLDLIGVSNEFGLHVSRAQRIADLSRYKIIKIGWLAYNPMRVNVGSIGIAKGSEHLGIVSPDYVVLACTEKILPDYLLFFLKSDLGLEAINKNASGAVRKRLYYSDLARIELNVPSIDRQLEILTSVKKIEAMVSQLRDPKRLEKVYQLKQSIFQEAIQGKLTAEWRAGRHAAGIETEPAGELLRRIQAEKARLNNPSTPLRAGEKKIKKEKPIAPITESEKPFELPEGWEWCRLGEILLFSDSGKSPNCEKRPANFNEWGVLTTTSIQAGIFLEDSNKVLPLKFKVDTSQKVEVNDLLITRAGPLNRTGVACKVKSITKQLILSDKTIRLKHPPELINPDFLVSGLNSKIIRALLIPKMTGMAESQVNISQPNIKQIPFPVPPLEEQKAIVEKVERLMEKCRALEQEISNSEQHAQMLMQAVLKEAFGK